VSRTRGKSPATDVIHRHEWGHIYFYLAAAFAVLALFWLLYPRSPGAGRSRGGLSGRPAFSIQGGGT